MIHPAAIVDPKAHIGSDVCIGPYTVVEGAVHVGPDSKIYNNVFLSGDTILGSGCIVHPFCSIGHFPQDVSFRTEISSGVRIGDGCEFREGVTVHRSAAEGGMTRIGSGVYIMTGGHVGHDVAIEDRVTMANCTHLAGHARVEQGAILSGNISVHQHVRIGAFSMVSASSFLNQDLPPYFIAFGIPAVVAGVNSVGLRRNGFDSDARARIKQVFRVLYREGHTVQCALDLLGSLDGPEAKAVLGFVRGSKRGILSGRKRR